MNKYIAWRWQVTSQNKITLLTSFLSESYFFFFILHHHSDFMTRSAFDYKIFLKNSNVFPRSQVFEKFYRCIIIAQRKKERRPSSVDSQVNQFAKGNTWFDGTQQPITWVMGSCGTSFALSIDPQFACNYFKTFPDIFFITIMSISLSVLAKKL